MIKVKRKVKIPIEPVEITFSGEFHNEDYEKGDFYYSVTANVDSSKKAIQPWERSLEARLRNQLKQQRIEEELKMKALDLVVKKIKKGVKK